MASMVRKMEIHNLKVHLELNSLRCAFLVRQFDAAKTPEQKNLLSSRWQRAILEGHAYRYKLRLLEKEERPTRRPPSSDPLWRSNLPNRDQTCQRSA